MKSTMKIKSKMSCARLRYACKANPCVLLLPCGLLLLMGTAGCSKEPTLETYPVDGRVVVKGGQPPAGWAIRFQPKDDTSLIVGGEIGEDGKFSLSTVKGKDKFAGAVVGQYRVTIIAPISADQRGGGQIILPHTYQVEAKENHFEIEVDPPKTRP
jgi:hypothetical protein